MANKRNKSATGVTVTDFGADSLLKTASNREAARNLDTRRNTVRVPPPVSNARLGKTAGSKVGNSTRTKGGAI